MIAIILCLLAVPVVGFIIYALKETKGKSAEEKAAAAAAGAAAGATAAMMFGGALAMFIVIVTIIWFGLQAVKGLF